MVMSAASTSFRLHGKECEISGAKVRRAMRIFNRELRKVEPESGSGYVLIDKGLPYPPKRILGLIIGARGTPDYQRIPGYSGGERTNRVFRQLGFTVRRASRVLKRSTGRWKVSIPAPVELTAEVFRQKWTLLNRRSKFPDCPGVYVLAYSSGKLTGRRVSEDDVFYVGMSNHAGLAKRLYQFQMAIEYGHGHSGGKRFFHDYTKEKGYSKLSAREKSHFYVAAVSVPCVTSKRSRTPLDLRKMGAVAAAECEVLARIRQVSGAEPDLNSQ